MNLIIVIMGVSGSGKTTIGKTLADELKIPFFDGDDFHPEKNVKKMSKGVPLNDEDRLPWLKKINTHLKTQSSAILACSALKESYRKIISLELNIVWVYLKADFDVIKNRINERKNHFMPVTLLQSQFDALEAPNYGIHVNVKSSPKTIINKIIEHIKAKKMSAFGIYGLGVMGKSLALNVLNKDFSLSVFNIETETEKNVVSDFIKDANNPNVQGFTDVKNFIESLVRPRKILLMVKAGEVVDIVIKQLIDYLEEGDIVIDGGNSHYSDTKRRIESLKAKGIHLIGMGVSGGEEGALKGPSLMPSGNFEAYKLVAPILEAIAAKNKNNEPCCTYIGPEGAGHFVKMIHNGIEYGEMQLLAELYVLLAQQMSYDEISNLFNEWDKGELSSYLLKVTAVILATKEEDYYLLDKILDKAGNKGTGSWSSIAALEIGQPSTVFTSAVFARYISSFKEKRVQLSQKIDHTKTSISPIDSNILKMAYDFARTINMHQGIELIKQKSEDNSWHINLKEVLSVWSNGCIIKSEKLEVWKNALVNSSSLLDNNDIFLKLKTHENAIRELLQNSLKNRVAAQSFFAAYNYWIAMTTENSSANLIQAQRDFFGAHTYQRVDKDNSQFFHTNWQIND